VSRVHLVDMLDFSRIEFNKAISLNTSKKVEIESKYPLVKLGEICDLGRGRVISKQYIDENVGDYPVYSSQTLNDGVFGMIKTYDFEGEYVTWTTDGVYAGTCNYRSGKFNCTNVCGTLKAKNNNVNMQFLPLILNKVTDRYVTKLANPKLMNNTMAEVKIPLPPLDIQQQIVDECQTVDDEVAKANETIKELKNEIENEINSVGGEVVKLEKIISLNIETFDPTSEQNNNFIYVDIDSVGKGNGLVSYENIIIGKDAPSRARRIVKDDSVVISTVRPYLKGFAYIARQTPNCIFSTGFAVIQGKDNLSSKYLFLLFMFSSSLMKQMEEAMPKSAYPSINKKDIENFKISLPSLETQQQIVAKIEALEAKITQAQMVIDGSKARKEAVLKSYL
jgi:type I restriction enzyme M protein